MFHPGISGNTRGRPRRSLSGRAQVPVPSVPPPVTSSVLSPPSAPPPSSILSLTCYSLLLIPSPCPPASSFNIRRHPSTGKCSQLERRAGTPDFAAFHHGPLQLTHVSPSIHIVPVPPSSFSLQPSAFILFPFPSSVHTRVHFKRSNVSHSRTLELPLSLVIIVINSPAPRKEPRNKDIKKSQHILQQQLAMNANATKNPAQALTRSASDRPISLVITRKRLDKPLLFRCVSASVYEGLLSLFLLALNRNQTWNDRHV